MNSAASAPAKRERVETVVVGGGQAGLAVGYHLARRNLPFVVLDANERIGDSWRKRWDSLRLFTPARYNALPGMAFPGPAHSFSTKDEVADYLEAYAVQLELPVRAGVRVDRLSRNGSRFVVEAGDRLFEAENVVVAMASHSVPRVPPFANELDPGIHQLHSGEYRNPSQLQEGQVLVVGAGNSGAEIAIEVVKEHSTWLAGNRIRSCPLPHRARAGTIRLPAAPVPVHRPPRADGAHPDRSQDAPEAPLPWCAAGTGQAEGPRCRRRRTRSSRRRRAGRTAAARRRPRPRARRTSSGARGSGPTSPGSISLSSARRTNRSSRSIAAGSSPMHPGCTSSGSSSSTRCRPGSFPASEEMRSTS